MFKIVRNFSRLTSKNKLLGKEKSKRLIDVRKIHTSLPQQRAVRFILFGAVVVGGIYYGRKIFEDVALKRKMKGGEGKINVLDNISKAEESVKDFLSEVNFSSKSNDTKPEENKQNISSTPETEDATSRDKIHTQVDSDMKDAKPKEPLK